MEKETATEWLFKQLWDEPKDKFTCNAILIKANEMHKEQIINAFDEGKSDGYKTARGWDEMIIFSNSEQYYNQKYKQD